MNKYDKEYQSEYHKQKYLSIMYFNEDFRLLPSRDKLKKCKCGNLTAKDMCPRCRERALTKSPYKEWGISIRDLMQEKIDSKYEPKQSKILW
jgi:hypothetical protein